MTMTDPLADLLTRIRNAYMRSKATLQCPHSHLKAGLLDVLQEQGYIRGYRIEELDKVKKNLIIELRYHDGKPAAQELKRISSPGRRVYARADKIPLVYNGLGVAVLSTSQGLKVDADARKARIGGEILCTLF